MLWKIRVKTEITINHGEEVTLPGGIDGEYGEWVDIKPRWMCDGVLQDAHNMVDNAVPFELMDLSGTIWSSTHKDIDFVLGDCYRQTIFFKVGLV